VTPEEGEFTPEQELGDLLETLVEALGLDATVAVITVDAELRGTVDGPGAAELIGPDGDLLNAIQYLAQRIVLRGGEGLHVTVDADGYRGRRAEILCSEADQAAELALAEQRAVPMRALPAAERRLVHEYLRERGDVATQSEGDEPNRRLVISPAGS
jgi:spoIIIJ-associated protein